MVPKPVTPEGRSPAEPFSAALANYEAGRLEESHAVLDGLLARQPQHVPALILSGIIAGQRRDLEEALLKFDRVLSIQPDNPRAHFNKANILLLRGEWEQGWREYEWRRQLAEFALGTRGEPAGLPWRSDEELRDKTVLLRCEQGLGDTLQFCRYVTSMAERGAQVILEAQRPLVSLLADLEGLAQIVTQGQPWPKCDYHIWLLSLPLACRTTPDRIPAPEGYLTADAAKVAEWRARLGETSKLHVGLVWRGTAARANDDRRSLPLEQLIPHLPREHRYVSLQKDLDEADVRTLRANRWIESFADQLHDFSDTAALCACMSLVVSIDTSVAHLSGALGKPTWILLQFSPAWRWLLDRDDSPWYRTVRLLRQAAPEDWQGVFQRLGQRLRELR